MERLPRSDWVQAQSERKGQQQTTKNVWDKTQIGLQIDNVAFYHAMDFNGFGQLLVLIFSEQMRVLLLLFFSCFGHKNICRPN